MSTLGMNKVLKGLYIGGLSDSRDQEKLRSHSVTHILSIHELAKPHYPGIFTYLCVDISDSYQQPITQIFGECIEFIHRARADGGKVLVHCLAGVSRSATVVCAYILARTNLDSEKAVCAIKAARSCATPNYGFRRQLQDWSKTERHRWRENLSSWPKVNHDDIKRCSRLLALYNSQVKGSKDKKASIPLPSPTSATLEEGAAQSPPPSQPTEEINPRQSTASSGSINSALSAEEQQSSGAPSTSGSTGEKAHVPIIMGNTGSSSYVYEIPHCEPAVKKENSRMDKVRNSIRNALNRKPSKDYFDKNKKKKEDQANNNNGVVKPAGDDIDGSYYTDNITRSATLPNNYGRQIPNGNTPINDTLKNATLQARLLPAYKTPEQGYIGNIENRRRIMSTPAYSRNRTHSQSSNYSQRYHSTNRVVSTHIPAHIDKRLVRSRSVGVIPDAELKMRKTASASVVKIDDCEDWIV